MENLDDQLVGASRCSAWRIAASAERNSAAPCSSDRLLRSTTARQAAWRSASLTASAVRRVSVGSASIAWLVDLLPNGVFADAEQNMHTVIGGISLLLREEVLEDVIGGFADNRVRRDQDR